MNTAARLRHRAWVAGMSDDRLAEYLGGAQAAGNERLERWAQEELVMRGERYRGEQEREVNCAE